MKKVIFRCPDCQRLFVIYQWLSQATILKIFPGWELAKNIENDNVLYEDKRCVPCHQRHGCPDRKST
jgi:hypothetical protein